MDEKEKDCKDVKPDNKDKKDYRQKKGQRQKGRKQGREEGKDARQIHENDVAWYSASEQLLHDAASLPYSNAVGDPILSGSGLTNDLAVPGIMTFSTDLGTGISRNGSSPVNVAARKIYSYVRHANSGHSNYESPDLTIYILAMDQIYSWIAHGKRAYGIAMSYALKNRYIPARILDSLDFDGTDVLNNLANLRYGINAAISRVSALAVPGTSSLVARHAWMYSHLWKDSESMKSQIYAFKPFNYGTFTPVQTTTGSSITKSVVPGPMTVAQYLTILNSMIAAVMEDEDVNIMSGDILKAYGEERLIKLAMLSDDYVCFPEHSIEVLGQIQNATIFKVADFAGSNFDITQDTAGNIIYDPTLSTSVTLVSAMAKNKVINSFLDFPTPAATMVNTRLTAIVDTTADGNNRYHLECGSELIVKSDIYYNQIAAATGAITFAHIAFEQFYDWTTNMNFIAGFLSCFDFHPAAYVCGTYTISGTTYYAPEVMFEDFDNYTQLSQDTLKKMNVTALLSEFGLLYTGNIVEVRTQA